MGERYWTPTPARLIPAGVMSCAALLFLGENRALTWRALLAVLVLLIIVYGATCFLLRLGRHGRQRLLATWVGNGATFALLLFIRSAIQGEDTPPWLMDTCAVFGSRSTLSRFVDALLIVNLCYLLLAAYAFVLTARRRKHRC